MSHTEEDTVKTVWDSSFDPAEQGSLRSEDSEAWFGVTGLLIFLASTGVLLAIVTLFIIWAAQF